jgi:hypothetical protein
MPHSNDQEEVNTEAASESFHSAGMMRTIVSGMNNFC